jgi:hypothetical protein
MGDAGLEPSGFLSAIGDGELETSDCPSAIGDAQLEASGSLSAAGSCRLEASVCLSPVSDRALDAAGCLPLMGTGRGTAAARISRPSTRTVTPLDSTLPPNVKPDASPCLPTLSLSEDSSNGSASASSRPQDLTRRGGGVARGARLTEAGTICPHRPTHKFRAAINSQIRTLSAARCSRSPSKWRN